MKHIFNYLMCVCIMLFGSLYMLQCGDASRYSEESSILCSSVTINEGIQVVGKRPYVKRNEIGMLALKCKPKVKCKIVCNYKVNGKAYQIVENILAGKDGNVMYTWKVDGNTDVGSYVIEITSGNYRMVTNYVVQ